MRSLSLALPCSNSQVHLTSLAVNGLPSCHLTPSCNLNVNFVLLGSHDQLDARSGTTVSALSCDFAGSNITRLLKTGMNGILTDTVASSRIEALGGLSR